MYGVSTDYIVGLRAWAQQWADDIRRRLYTENLLEESGGDGWP
jgi:hypothetical protein